jgi:hypothetical protein
MNNEVKGRVVAIPPAQTGMGQRGPWRRQTVVVEYEAGRFNQKLALECSNNKAEAFGNLQIGQMVSIKYDVTSREYNGKWYTSANAFDFSVEGAQQQYQAPSPATAPQSGDAPF